MTRSEFEDHLIRLGWTKDRWGNYKKESGDRVLRMKLNAQSVRYERQIHFEASDYSPARNEWVRIGSGYYSKLSISENGKIQGMKR